MKISVKNVVESVSMILLSASLITGCCKVGKGVKITDNLNKTPKPYPVVDTITTTTTNKTSELCKITFTTTSVITETTTTETTVVDDNIDQMHFIKEAEDTNVEEVVNDDVSETTFENDYSNGYPSVMNGYITEEERVFLCNTVGTEWGSDWVSLYDKALVVDTVMTRVDEGRWTNGLESTVYNVLTAPGQYNPWYAENVYHDNVTQSCIDAVEYYFAHRDEFPHYNSFYGDGVTNYFYSN